ncbi:DUF1360 domain-containing protein [Kibdelosporangium philippinense]|uniref:DUF1360 domain-containing protein n=1 Tax=Kibdelosporangium philippinense TaxID=211113 RepID=A0ABS8ZT05_9PSEU|nr:DUF1360 domain-containing protein [Kibdelosporangium philippinense]MCE7010844.1 DUF1360 domain-containing protein [Kibdelosporangium philippinense]
MRAVDRVRDALAQVRKRYQNGEDRPLLGYATVLGAYGGVVGLLAAAGRVTGTRLPERFSLGDTVLVGIATHKASRLLAKDAVTSPLRAPFTRYEEPAGDGELNESVHGHGVRHAAGELMTCPFCLAVWVATGLTAGMVFAPRFTRAASTVLTAVAVSDVLQLGYDSAKQMAG